MTFYSETDHKAAKDHTCDACRRKISAGERYTRWTGNEDGFASVAYHTDCRLAEIAYNKLLESHWGEWASLSEVEIDDFDWLCDAFPSVAARFGWSMYDWREVNIHRWGSNGLYMATPRLEPQEHAA